jgi:hypothetical protein
MSVLIAILLAIALLGVLAKNAELRARVDFLRSENYDLECEAEQLEGDHEALLKRANELAHEKWVWQRDQSNTISILRRLEAEAKDPVLAYSKARRGLETIVNWTVGDEKLTVGLIKDTARASLTGLTHAGLAETIANHLKDISTLPQGETYADGRPAVDVLRESGGVVADQRNVKVDISGQVERAKELREAPRELTIVNIDGKSGQGIIDAKKQATAGVQ